jgi:hypothetical protein
MIQLMTMIDRNPAIPPVPLAALEPVRATPFGPHRPLPVISLTKSDVRGSAGNAPAEKPV